MTRKKYKNHRQKNIHNNFLQVTNQVVGEGTKCNRYDVTVLVNGLPLVHIELKKRGVNLHEAFNQIHRYSKESFNSDNSLYKYVQIFVISNGTYTRYFANTTAHNKNNYEFTCEWADAKNKVIHDLEDFTKTFFEKRVILEVLTKYCVFDVNNTLLIMRPYQIAAAERILWKIKSSYEAKKAGKHGAGDFIWHTTGSGKTLTSFKAARLATELSFIGKVFFVVDRKDLDYQTMKEYQRFQSDSVNGSKDTKKLKESIEKDDNRIVVTTIQKLNEFIKKILHMKFMINIVYLYLMNVTALNSGKHKKIYGNVLKSIINSVLLEHQYFPKILYPDWHDKTDKEYIDFSDVEFQIDLLKTDEINLDYILALILEKSKDSDDIENLKSEVRRVIRSSLGTRAKEELIMDFINVIDLSELKTTDDILDSFYNFAKKEKENQIDIVIKEEKLREDSKRFIEKAIGKGYMEYAGDELDRIIPPTSRRHGEREKKKESVLDKIRRLVEVFVGI